MQGILFTVLKFTHHRADAGFHLGAGVKILYYARTHMTSAKLEVPYGRGSVVLMLFYAICASFLSILKMGFKNPQSMWHPTILRVQQPIHFLLGPLY